MRADRWMRLMSVGVLVAVFVAGGLCGAGLLRIAHPPRPELAKPPGPIEAMTHELELDADQARALRAIADAHHADLQAILRTAQPKIREVLYAIEDELRPRLRPEQVRALETWRARRRAPNL